ncbi:hypothetical protein P7K49_018702 [Saguinus oedipus]|uniref:Uncharacterized protein n=1 Tax=Saguinus oedipus TaxID=9490 RepID=A0ABQ9V645_SAGOE|nr:hypothetical protein P7K49_018702 [Saguinus oedipus]
MLVRMTDKTMPLLHENKFLFQVVLAGAFYPNYFTFGQPDEEMAVRELAGKDPKTTVVLCTTGRVLQDSSSDIQQLCLHPLTTGSRELSCWLVVKRGHSKKAQ